MAGTKLMHVKPQHRPKAPLTLVPSYPDLPMERVFTNGWQTDTPMVYLPQGGQGQGGLFPHRPGPQLLGDFQPGSPGAVCAMRWQWATGGEQPLTVTGPGMVDVSYWRQKDSVAAHLVNLTNPMAMKGYMREKIRTLRDSGPGIPPEISEQIFNPFFTTKKTGVGLGLAIVSKIVDEHHGSLRLESEPGRGACFHVYFPAAEISAHASTSPQSHES